MNIAGGALYKVVEFDKGIVILNALDDIMSRPGTRELVVATAPNVGEFLLRYLFARAGGHLGVVGKDQEAALKDALAGAIVTKSALDK